jgi:ferric-dicitrate binding protein FerR (iron transport regulator)
MDPHRRHQAADVVQREGHDWVEKLTSGEATLDDAAALLDWRSRSPAHVQALSDAMSFRRACEQIADEDWPEFTSRPDQPDRRWVLGAVAASAAGIFAVAGGSRYLSQRSVDFETGPGVRRNVRLPDGAQLELSTKTQVSRLHPSEGNGVRLLSGELFVRTGTQAFSVVCSDGATSTRHAAFNVRRDARSTLVTCVDGEVAVSRGPQRALLQAGRQITYDARRLGEPAAIDVAGVTAWRQGMLIFRNVRLERVVAELNRYRAQPIILVDSRIANRTVYAVFRTDQADAMIAQISRLAGAAAVHLPGGAVLLA